jgi:hypothetical protein
MTKLKRRMTKIKRISRRGACPYKRELTPTICGGVAATARVARGQAPRLHIYALCLEKCVVDGFTPSRPLRSLVPKAKEVAE